MCIASITASMNKLLDTLLAPAFATPIPVAVACCPTLYWTVSENPLAAHVSFREPP
jgi:hypothetical protein